MVLSQGQKDQMATKKVLRNLLVTGMLIVLKYFVIKQEPEVFKVQIF